MMTCGKHTARPEQCFKKQKHVAGPECRQAALSPHSCTPAPNTLRAGSPGVGSGIHSFFVVSNLRAMHSPFFLVSNLCARTFPFFLVSNLCAFLIYGVKPVCNALSPFSWSQSKRRVPLCLRFDCLWPKAANVVTLHIGDSHLIISITV